MTNTVRRPLGDELVQRAHLWVRKAVLQRQLHKKRNHYGDALLSFGNVVEQAQIVNVVMGRMEPCCHVKKFSMQKEYDAKRSARLERRHASEPMKQTFKTTADLVSRLWGRKRRYYLNSLVC